MLTAAVNDTSDVVMVESQHDVAVAELDIAMAPDGPATYDQAEAVVEVVSAALDGAGNGLRLLDRFGESHSG